MTTFLTLENKHETQLPQEFRHDDVRYTESLVEYYLKQYTNEADTVLDPFVGFGTTIRVAERMGRAAFGVEYDHARWRLVQNGVRHPERIIHGDSTKIGTLGFPPIDFSMTSPPYMGHHHKENPFTAYSTIGGGYQHYLETFADIYRQIAELLKPNGHVVIEVSNLKHNDAPITTLAWDIAKSVSNVLNFEGETVVCWTNGYGAGYDHSYCLLYSKKA